MLTICLQNLEQIRRSFRVATFIADCYKCGHPLFKLFLREFWIYCCISISRRVKSIYTVNMKIILEVATFIAFWGWYAINVATYTFWPLSGTVLKISTSRFHYFVRKRFRILIHISKLGYRNYFSMGNYFLVEKWKRWPHLWHYTIIKHKTIINWTFLTLIIGLGQNNMVNVTILRHK